jgi:2',3'-cyclic-nucleotide 2'-phosphodiesterase (5'-nucleotidase family)
MEENFLAEVQKENVEGLDVLPVAATLSSYIPELDKQTDLIVFVSHGWF